MGDHLGTAWNGSAWRFPILIPPTLLALWILRRQGAEWFAVPAVWPATQFYYVAMALPAVAKRPILAAAFAVPAPLLVPVVVMALAAWEWWSGWQRSRGHADPVESAPPWLRRLVGVVR